MRTDLKTIRCIVYRRVSTEKQAGDVYTSLEDQLHACEQLAAKLGVSIGHVYSDDGFSGSTIDKRPAMREMLADCAAAPKNGAPAYVLVLNDSRFGRFPDPEESTYWRFTLSKLGWHVRFAENDETENKPIRAIMRAMVAGQATQKREDVKANAKRGMKGTVERGYWCSQAPYGYRRKVVYPIGRERVLESGVRKAIDEKVVLVQHKEEAAIIRELFVRYATGEHSVQSLIDWATEVAPAHTWKHSSVQRALTNPAYVGDIVFGRTPADHAERAARPTRDVSDWYVHRSAHAPIIDRDLYDVVQEMLARNRRTTRGVRSDWVLSGIVLCRCGAPMVSGGGGRRKRRNGRMTGEYFQPSYRCSTTNKPAHRCEYSGTVAKNALEEVVIREIAREASTPIAQARLAEYLDAALEASQVSPAAEFDALKKERDGLALRRDRILAAIEEGTITAADAKSRLTQIATADARLLGQIETALSRKQDKRRLRTDRDRIVRLFADMPLFLKSLSGPALREMIRPWIRRAVFNTDTRQLRLEIRHIPRMHMLSGPRGRRPEQDHGRDPVTVRRVIVPRRAAA